jgi:4-amino-4-deoxy-L-arabinose transferase-like glycosyltransferase
MDSAPGIALGPAPGRTTLHERLFSLTGLLLAWFTLVLAQLPIREVTPPDEPRFAHQAESMKSSGDWVVPRIGDDRNVEKPPLLFWSIVIASLPFDRVTETTARIPSAIASLIVLLLTVRLGRRLWGSDAIAYGGALVTLTGIEFFQKSQWCSCDMILAAFAWTAITFWGEALFGEPPPRHAAILVALGWIAVALGILTKGPVALLWPLFWVAAEAVARGRARPLLRIARNPGVVLALAIVGGWLWAVGARAGWAFVREAALRQGLERYAHATNNVHPWWFFVFQTPADLVPWVVFLPAALALAIRRGTMLDEGRSRIAPRALALFALFAILFFSTSPGKRGVYVLESFPALSLLIAAAVVRAGRGRLGFALLCVVGLGLALVVPAAVVSGAVTIPHALTAAAGMTGVAALVACGFALGAGGGAGWVFLRRGRCEAALASAVAGTIVATALAGSVGGVAWSRMQRARPFCATIA